jgi:hypothetical protein
VGVALGPDDVRRLNEHARAVGLRTGRKMVFVVAGSGEEREGVES